MNKKIFKVSFSKKTKDFFILLPYFETEEYNIGTINMPKGIGKLEKFNVVDNGKSSKIPVKFSYHKDGNVHFKPTNQKLANVSLSYKLAKTKATPLSMLNGEHLFTVQFENMNRFEDIDFENKKSVKSICKIPDDAKFIKILGFAGDSVKKVSNKYKGNCIIIEIKRGMQKNLFVGIYVLPFKESISTNEDKNGYLLSLVGFQKKSISIDEKFKCLYVYAK